MGSGKYAALSGAISRMQMLDNINSNLANINTSGYKKGIAIFAAQLTEAQANRSNQPTNFVRIAGEGIDFSQGGLNKTGNPMHLAINGKGFFRIQQTDGEIAYARRGSFKRNETGEMETLSGGKLLGAGDAPVVLPLGEVNFTRDGSILSDNQLSGRIPLYVFEDTSQLKRGNEGVFLAPSSAQPTEDPQAEMLQGFLEGSNVNVMQEMARMVSNKRSFEASQKALSAYNTMDSKLAELGNIQ